MDHEPKPRELFVTKSDGKDIVVTLLGVDDELDFSTVTEIQDRLLGIVDDREIEWLTIEMQHLVFIDASVLHLVKLLAEARSNINPYIPLKLRVNSRHAKLFEISGLKTDLNGDFERLLHIEIVADDQEPAPNSDFPELGSGPLI